MLHLTDIDNPTNAEKIPIIDIDMRQPYYNRAKAQATEGKEVAGNMVHGRTSREKGMKKNDDPDKDPETLFAKKIQEYTVDEGGTPTQAETSYTNLMKNLRAVYKEVDVPASLDEYFHESIDEDELNIRNGDQVISRFIARQRAETELSAEPPAAKAMTDDLQRDASPGELEAGLGSPSSTAESTHQFRQRIITVPRCWIWKVDGKHMGCNPHVNEV